MATIAQTAPLSPHPWHWFQEFLKEELAPYPGRAALVARMVIAATLVMIINMTFRIPYGAYGAVYALTISRESFQATLKEVKTILTAFVFAAATVVIGAMLFLGEPTLRFLWVIGILFAMFFALKTMTNYTAAARFGYMVVITIPLWDRHTPAELRVEGTLWAVAAVAIGSLITILVELVSAQLRPGDDLVRSVTHRLECVEQLLTCYAARCLMEEKWSEQLTRLTMVGTSRQRRNLQRSAYSRQYKEQMGTVLALVGRLVDIAAELTLLSFDVPDDSRKRMGNLAGNIAKLRADLLSGTTPRPIEFDANGARVLPLLSAMESTVSLIPEVFAGPQSPSPHPPPASPDEPPSRLFVPDALSNSEHLKFGLRGCLAASLCYIAYTSLNWPEISTAVTTCLLTALTTVGASRQKQVLRFAGALVGGLVVGIGAQVFILPALDSIFGFTLLFVAVTILAAWIATSGPRLSYFGIQVAVAFYLINLLEFKVQTSLEVARDRVLGILLGLFMMWLAFDQLGGVPAAVDMKRKSVSNLRLLAQFAREPLSADLGVAMERSYSLRETINKNFDQVRALADGVLFEFGPSRQQDLALRDRIRRWQPQLRLLFVTRIALLKYRLHLPGFQLPEAVLQAQKEFDNRLATTLDGMAGRLEGQGSEARENLQDSLERLEQTTLRCCSELPEETLPPQLQTFLSLSRRIANLTNALRNEI
jgi:multidrug resistance protein MdtO